LTHNIQPPEPDLAPPLTLRDVSQVLREIMTVYDSSMLELEASSTYAESNSSAAASERQEFDRIMDAAVHPALEMCSRMADLMKTKDQTELVWDKEIFLANCTSYLQSTFHSFTFAEPRVASMDKELDKHVNLLVQEHYTRMLQDGGLSNIIDAISSKPADTPLSRLPTASTQSITQALSTFDTFLSSLDVLTSPRLSLISTPTLASRIHRTALQRIGKAYGKVADAVRDPKNKYEFATTMLGAKRPFGQMNVLWQVLGVDGSGTANI